MLSLIKDTRGDISSSDNYRAISLSTVLIKIFVSIIILLAVLKCYQQATSNVVLKGNIQLFNIPRWSKKL